MHHLEHRYGDLRFLTPKLQSRAQLIAGVYEISIFTRGIRQGRDVWRDKLQINRDFDQV